MQAVLWLVILLIPSAHTLADKPDIDYLLTESFNLETFPNVATGTESAVNVAELESEVISQASYTQQKLRSVRPWRSVQVGYENGFVIASPCDVNLRSCDSPYLLRMNGWGQLRHAILDSQGPNQDINQFQLKRARLIFSGHAYTPDFGYFVQLDGRSSSGDDVRLLDYFLTYDIGHHIWEMNKGQLTFKTGKYKMPFTMARYLSGREFEFTDRSMASMFFDVNRSLAWGLAGNRNLWSVPCSWEVAIFNGLVTGGAETGSSGALDDNFAYSGRIFVYPLGEWGAGELVDFEEHEQVAVRTGLAFAHSKIESSGSTEFSSLRVVDSGVSLASILPGAVSQYTTNLYSVDMSLKWRGWSTTFEYYFRQVGHFDAPAVDTLFDHGFWLQLGKFVLPRKLQLLTRWSRVVGNSGTLGSTNLSSDEIAGGVAWYFREQNAKLTLDATYLNGAPINSSSLDISPGDMGWLIRSQIQFAF